MSEKYTEVRQVSVGENMGGSCLGTIFVLLIPVFALLIFLYSFYLLFWNEGRMNLAAVAKTAIEVSAIVRPDNAQGQFVSVTGAATTNAPLGDGQFLLPGNYVLVDRTVEIYAWEEKKDTDREQNFWGSATERTTYTYDAVWTNNPQASSGFRYSANHQNPPKAIPDQLFTMPSVQIDRYTLPLSGLNQLYSHRISCVYRDAKAYYLNERIDVNLPKSGYLQLDPQNTQLSEKASLTPNYIFQGNGSPDRPQIGDMRVCYTVLPAGETVTAFGQLAHTQILPYFYQDKPIYRLMPGTRDSAIARLTMEEIVSKWLTRLFGLILMWGGLYGMVAPPVVIFLDVTSLTGNMTRQRIVVGCLVIAVVLSTITILISWFWHDPILVLAGLSVAIGIGFVLWGRR